MRINISTEKIPNWRELRDYVASLPDRDKLVYIEREQTTSFAMYRWLSVNRPEETVREALQPECGSAMCLYGASFLLAMFHKDPDAKIPKGFYYDELAPTDIDPTDIMKITANEFLGITEKAAEEYVWNGKWSYRNINAERDDAIEFLDKVIAGGGWEM